MSAAAGDDEDFCGDCLAGMESSEHHRKCDKPTPGDGTWFFCPKCELPRARQSTVFFAPVGTAPGGPGWTPIGTTVMCSCDLFGRPS